MLGNINDYYLNIAHLFDISPACLKGKSSNRNYFLDQPLSTGVLWNHRVPHQPLSTRVSSVIFMGFLEQFLP